MKTAKQYLLGKFLDFPSIEGLMEDYASEVSSSKEARIKELESELIRYHKALRLIRDFDDDIETIHGDPGSIAIAALNPPKP